MGLSDISVHAYLHLAWYSHGGNPAAMFALQHQLLSGPRERDDSVSDS